MVSTVRSKGREENGSRRSRNSSERWAKPPGSEAASMPCVCLRLTGAIAAGVIWAERPAIAAAAAVVAAFCASASTLL